MATLQERLDNFGNGTVKRQQTHTTEYNKDILQERLNAFGNQAGTVQRSQTTTTPASNYAAQSGTQQWSAPRQEAYNPSGLTDMTDDELSMREAALQKLVNSNRFYTEQLGRTQDAAAKQAEANLKAVQEARGLKRLGAYSDEEIRGMSMADIDTTIDQLNEQLKYAKDNQMDAQALEYQSRISVLQGARSQKLQGRAQTYDDFTAEELRQRLNNLEQQQNALRQKATSTGNGQYWQDAARMGYQKEELQQAHYQAKAREYDEDTVQMAMNAVRGQMELADLMQREGDYADIKAKSAEVNAALEAAKAKAHNTGADWDSLERYAERLVNKERMESLSQSAKDEVNEDDSIAGAMLKHSASQILGGLGALDMTAQAIGNIGRSAADYQPIDPNTNFNRYSILADAYQEGGAELVEQYAQKDPVLGKFLTGKDYVTGDQSRAQYLYGVGVSSLDSAVNLGVSMLLAAGIGTVVPMSAEVFNTTSARLVNAIMGSSAATSAIRENLESGDMTDAQAVTLGIMSGVAEAMTESWSIETLLNGDTTAFARLINRLVKNPVANNLLKGFISEGSEEIASNWLNRLFDYIVRHDKSQTMQDYNTYLAQGDSSGEAWRKIFAQWLQEDASSGLAGSLAGLTGGASHYMLTGTVDSVDTYITEREANRIARETEAAAMQQAEANAPQTAETAAQTAFQQEESTAESRTTDNPAAETMQREMDAMERELSGKDRVPYTEMSEDALNAWDSHNDVAMDAENRLYRVDPAQHISQRTSDNVSSRKMNAFQFDHPELQRYYREAAQALSADAALSLDAPVTQRTQRGTSGKKTIREIMATPALRAGMDMGLSRRDIIRAAEDLIADHGQENNAAAKRLELVLDQMLTDGYTTATGETVGPNEAYISAKKEIPGFSQQTREALSNPDMEGVSDVYVGTDRNRSEADIDSDILQVARSATILGESGAKALTNSYDRATAQRISPEEAVTGFTRIYNAALEGKELPNEAIPAHMRMAAEYAGKNDATRAAQAKYFGENAELVRDANFKKAHLSSRTARRLDALAKVLGVRIRFAEEVGGGLANAEYKSGEIVLALDAKDPVNTSVIHEAIHRLRESDPKLYNELATFIQTNLSADRYFNSIIERMQRYDNSSVDYLSEEIVADAFGRMMKGGEILDRYVQDHRTGAEKLRDILSDIVNAVQRALNRQDLKLSREQREEFKELEAQFSTMERKLAAALDAAAKRTEARETSKKAATTGGGRYSTKTEVLSMQNIDWADNFSSIKEQLRIHSNELAAMNPVASVEYVPNSSKTLVQSIIAEVKKLGGNHMRNSGISFDFDEGGAKSINAHAKSHETRAAALAAPYVAKYGKLISGQRNHENQGLTTVTFAAPVIINGQTVNVGVIVQFATNGRPHAVNVGLQSGAAFEIDMKKAPKGLDSRVSRYGQGTTLPTMGANNSVATNSTEVNKKFSMKSPIEETQDLLALHNKDERNILEAIKLGGLPMPSIAVVKASEGHSKYGPISLVFNKATIDPQLDSRNKVYGGDAWTPTAPQIDYSVDSRKAQQLESELHRLSGDTSVAGGIFGNSSVLRSAGIDDSTTKNTSELAESLARTDAVHAAYLAEQGKTLEPVKEAKEWDRYGNDTLQRVIDRLGVNRLAETVAELETGESIENALGESADVIRDILRDYYQEKGEPMLRKMAERKKWTAAEISEQRKARVDRSMENVTVFALEDMVRHAWAMYQDGGKTLGEIDRLATSQALRNAVDDKAVEAWISGKLDGLLGKAGIYNGKDPYTASGNRRSFSQLHSPYTLENIVKAMKEGQEERGGSTWGASAKTLMSVATPEYRSIQEIKADSKRLGLEDSAEFTASIQAIDDQIERIVTKIKQGNTAHSSNPFIESDIIGEILVEAAKGKKTVDAIMRTFAKSDYKISSQTAQDIQAVYKATAEMPTGYFEAKPRRAVGFDEVLAAVIPDNSSKTLRDGLAQVGVQTLEYKAGDETDRLAKINSVDGARFSLKRTSKMTLNEQLKMFYDGKMASSDAFYFGETPIELKNTGFDVLPLAMTIHDFRKSTQEKHNIPRRVLKNLMNNLKSPLFAFVAGNRVGIVLNDIDGDGKKVLAALERGTDMDREPVNVINSLYGLDRPEKWIKNQVESGSKFVLYDEERANAFLQTYGYKASVGDSIRSLDETVTQKKESVKGKNSKEEIPTEELLSELVKRYGAMPTGENPFRDIVLPKKTAKEMKLSQTVRTILEAKATPEVMAPSIQKLAAEGAHSYESYSDKAALSDAEATIRDVGWGKALEEWTKAVRSGEVSKANTAMGWALYDNSVNSGDTATALTVLNYMVEHQHSAAQAVQATRILKKMNPETQLYGVQRSIANLQKEINERYGKKGVKLVINEELAERFMKAETQTERDNVLADIYRDIGRQVPSGFRDKWNAWRYLSMLGNPRTHVRNIVGNAGFAPVVAVKNLTATGIEAAVDFVSKGQLQRSKGLLLPTANDRALLKSAYNDYAKIQESAMGGGKYSDLAAANKYVEEGRKIFRLKGLEWLRKTNGALLDLEDVWFSRPHYANALAQYCKANHITAEQIAEGGEAIKNARAYAILEAQKATYRDTNAFSQAVSELGKSKLRGNSVSAVTSTLMEGILPFRKTPANILVRGVEYSPIGLMWSIKQGITDIKAGKKTGAQVIDGISAGLTGTGLAALGFYLASQLLVRGGGGDDDKKKAFDDLTGHQTYALELEDGTSITLDWLAPECLPFFVGVNLYEAMRDNQGELTMSDILGAITQVSEPLMELSCLQSLNSVFDAVGSVSNSGIAGLPKALINSATSYFTQALPTLFGQIERTGEDKRYTTYTEKNAFLTGDMQYAMGKASARIPGWDFQQIPYIDAWGRIEYTGDLPKRALNNFLNPAYTSTVNSSDVEKELLRLYEATGESGVFPQRAPKYFVANKEQKDLTAEEYVKYATEKGKKSLEFVTEIVKSDLYRSMDDNQKADVIAEAYKAANQLAKASISGYSVDKWIQDASKAEKQTGISVAKVVLIREACGGIKGIKDKDGDTIANTKGLLVMQKIYSIPGLTDKQRETLFEMMDVGKTIRHLNKAAVDEKLKRIEKQAKK